MADDIANLVAAKLRENKPRNSRTTLNSYGRVSVERQGEIIGGLGLA